MWMYDTVCVYICILYILYTFGSALVYTFIWLAFNLASQQLSAPHSFVFVSLELDIDIKGCIQRDPLSEWFVHLLSPSPDGRLRWLLSSTQRRRADLIVNLWFDLIVTGFFLQRTFACLYIYMYSIYAFIIIHLHFEGCCLKAEMCICDIWYPLR